MNRILAACALMPALSAWASDPSETCFNSLEARQSLAPLQALIALGNISTQTVDMMSNVRHPTPAEKPVIKAWVRERDSCFVLGDQWRRENMPPVMREVLEDSYAKNKLLIADLYRANITYGEFNIRRAALASELRAGLDAAWRASRERRAALPETPHERRNAEARAAMLAAATRAFDEAPAHSAGSSASVECVGGEEDDGADAGEEINAGPDADAGCQ